MKVKKIVLILVFICFAEVLMADSDEYSLRLGYGYADSNDLGEILTVNSSRFSGKTTALNFDGGVKIVDDFYELPIDFYVKGGLSYFDEKGLNDYGNFWEATVYIKAYYKIDFWKNRVRVGFGEGLSLAQEIPVAELADATNPDNSTDPTSKFLNYLDISIDFDIGRLIRVDALHDTYIGYTLKHRSGIFGTFNGVHGGSNYNLITLEKNF